MSNTNYKKLYRTHEGRLLFGVCSGLSAYFQVDPTIIRVLFIILALFGGPGIILYILMAIFVPNEPAAPTGDATPPPAA